MYAIIDQNGKQYKVSSGDRIKLDTPLDDETKTLTFDRVLLVGGEGDAKIGAPTVAGATVTAEVLRLQVKGKKIVTQKYARRKGAHKKIGHRQKYTEVKITAINV